MRVILNAPITIGDKFLSSQIIDAGCDVIFSHDSFTNMDVAAAFGRAGFEPNDLWIRQEAANRLLQRFRKDGVIKYAKRLWTRVPV